LDGVVKQLARFARGVAEKLTCNFSVNVGNIDLLERSDAKRVLR
jgi:hypothetical protein